LSERIGTERACHTLGVPRSSFYRNRLALGQPDALGRTDPPNRARAVPVKPARALTQAERVVVRDLLNSERFQDCSPRQVWAALLDEGRYVCSWRTMYRILEEHDEVRERRNQLRHPVYQKPELLATKPNELWSWDITKLKGPLKWRYYYLYVILDVFSRFVVGWMVAERESSELAKVLIETSHVRQGIAPGQLTIHSDRGPSMKSKTVAELMVDLGVEKTHSRPHVSNDNPYSEAQFKTLKYRPDYPRRFGSSVDARGWAGPFFRWYNEEHYHSGLGLMTPEVVHYGQAASVRARRQLVLEAAYADHPERFVRGLPEVPEVPSAVWINKPESIQKEESLLLGCGDGDNAGLSVGPCEVVPISTTAVGPSTRLGFDTNF
jgi:putative transposase